MTLTVQEVGGASSVVGHQGANNTAQAVNQDYDTFLRLLTAQIKNQDPLAPIDGTEFVAQLATFSQVEQQILANGKLDGLAAMMQGVNARLDVSYIGKEVEAEVDKFSHEGGSKQFAYAVSDEADSVRILIKNEAGDTVRILDGESGYGRQDITWDGKDVEGVVAPAGIYNVEIVAMKDEDEIEASIVTTDIVKEIIRDPATGDSMLVLEGGGHVYTENVLRILNPGAAA